MPLPLITTIIPAYNEGDRLQTFIQSWVELGFVQTTTRAVAIVVDDGSAADDSRKQRLTVELAAARLERRQSPHAVRYMRAELNRGKGAAIRLGWQHADPGSDWLGFIDGDGAVPAREYWRVAAMLAGTTADAVCGSRMKMPGRSVKRSRFRELQGRTFATGVERLFQLGMHDTQCGMKSFRGTLLRPLLAELREERWLLDIEVLALLKARGARIEETPIDCHERGGSSLVFGVDPVKMAGGLVRLRRRLGSSRGLATPHPAFPGQPGK